MAEEITPEKVAENASGADNFTVDGLAAKQVPIQDQIAAAKFAAANKPRRSRLAGCRFVPILESPNE